MDWHYTPYALPLFTGAAFLLAAAALGWERRRSEGGLAIALLSLLLMVYVLGYAFELGSQSLAQTRFWLGVEYVGIVFSPVVVLTIALLLSGRSYRLPARVTLMLLVPPILTIVLAWTNPQHELIWRGLHIDSSGAFTRTLFSPGPWYWVHMIYMQLMYLGSIALIVQAVLTRAFLLRRQARLVLVTVLLPVSTQVLGRMIFGDTGFDLVPYALVLSAMLIVVAILRYRFIDVLPIAHEAIVENIPDGVVVLNRNGQVVDLNPSALRLLQMESTQALIGQPASRVFARWPALLEVCCASGQSQVRLEVEEAGGIKHVEVIASPLADPYQRQVGRLVILRDVTGQVNLVLALRKSEERWRTYIELANDLIFTLGPGGVFRSVNQEVARVSGYQQEEIIGQNALMLVAPEQHAVIADTLRILFTGEAEAQMDVHILTRNGEHRILDVRGRLLPEEDSGPATFHIARDVTERRRADEELRQHRQQLEALVARRTRELQHEKERAEAVLFSTADAMIITDRAGVVQLINPAFERITGHARDQFIGQHSTIMATAIQMSAQLPSDLGASLLAGRPWRGDLTISHASGRAVEMDTYISAIMSAGGAVQGFVVALRDVTPFRSVERMKDALLATAAHELRTPLTTILGFSEIMLHRELKAGRQQHYLRLIYEQSMHLKAIIEDLLDVAKYEAGIEFDTEMDVLDMVALVRQTVTAVQEVHPEHRFCLEATGAMAVRGASLRLSQVLRNLLSNAAKYSEPGTAVDIRCCTEGEFARIAVRDEGIGLTGEQQTKIFQKFYRADMSNSAAGGTGLGLTIAKLIVEQHGGTIGFTSEAGRGSEFWFTVPLATSEERCPHRLRG